MLRKKCYTVRELFPLRRVNTVLFLDRMPGWKLLPLLTRSFASRGKDVRSRKRTRVERRETTTRWNTTKRAKVWIVIFFGLDPRCRSRARVPFRNSALMFRSIRYGTCSRSVVPVFISASFFRSTLKNWFDEVAKRNIIIWNKERDTKDDRLGYILSLRDRDVVTRISETMLSIDFWRVRDSRGTRSDSSSYETRSTFAIAIRFSILDRFARWLKRLAIKMRLDNSPMEKEKSGGMVKNRGVAICYLPFSTFGSNYSSAMRFDSGSIFIRSALNRDYLSAYFSRDLDRRDHSGRRSISIFNLVRFRVFLDPRDTYEISL